MKAQGCTNLHDALKETFLLPASDDRLPVVLFLTDGLPTVGQTSETAIRDLAVTINRHGRRVFTFGVGADVNVPLLDKIAADTRGESTYVLPGESVEEKVAKVFKQLSGPVLADVQFDAASQDGFTLVSDLQPKVLPDLYDGNQFVVLGKYRGDGPLRFRLAGNFRGRPRAFTFAFGLDKATTRNSFVPRLWASRRIGSLVEAVRQLGADIGIGNAGAGASNDPRVKELVDEIVRLGTEFGILTEYTAFLAREGTDLSDRDRVHTEANSNLVRRAINTRSGIAAVNQSANSSQMQRQQRVNRGNVRWTETMDRVSTANVQQVNDLTFYHRHGRWVDSRVVDRDTENEPTRVVEFGTPAFDELAHQLARQSRQGSMLLRGEIVMVVNGELVLIRGPAETSDQAKGKGRPRSR
jgi:Ca-activated chloride channel family protein